MDRVLRLATLPRLAGLVVIAILLDGCSGAQVTSNTPSTTTNTPSTTTPAATAGEATLSWSAPSQNTDGSPIMDLAGYHIYYGTDQSAPSQTINITEATATSYVVQELAPGTYYFTVVAYNASGIDSTDSNVAVKTI